MCNLNINVFSFVFIHLIWYIVACKKKEDEAIGIINACNKNTGGRMMVSNFRSFMDQEEDYLDMDMDMYDDDDHFDYYDYFY